MYVFLVMNFVAVVDIELKFCRRTGDAMDPKMNSHDAYTPAHPFPTIEKVLGGHMRGN